MMLIVDDFDINRAVLKSIFKWEYEILEAEDGEQALQIVEEAESIDVILLDIVMPKLDGIQVLERLKGDHKTERIPIIVNTQMSEQAQEIKCLELGADDFIGKPYNPQIIRRRVSNLLQKYVLERKQMEIELQQTSDQLHSLVDTVPGGIAVLQIQDGIQVAYVNDGLCEMLGYTRAEAEKILSGEISLFSSEKESERLLVRLRQETDQVVRINLDLMNKQKEHVWVGISAKRIAGEKKVTYNAVFLNLTKEKETQNQMLFTMEELLARVERDVLTGIYNRETFYEKIEEMIAKHENVEYVLILWNVDRFKVVNELFGTVIGDQLLIDFAGYLERLVKGKGVCGRLDADHFACCVPQEYLSENWELFQKVLEKGYIMPKINYPINFHVGLYVISDRKMPANKMCDRARMAQLTVKGNYIHRWAYYDNSLSESLLKEQELVNEMEHALEEGQFRVDYQPIFSAADEEIVSAEALVRWEHPKKGLISPGEFIPVFEKNGFIMKLDLYVWEQVCRFLSENKKAGIMNVPVSVNVSRLDFYNEEVFRILDEYLKKYDLSAKELKLEITESAYMENPKQLLDEMQQLQQKGFRILMDDFGSGYSSLNMLKDVPVDILKIDMKFIDTLDTSERACKILYNIIQMAQGLEMEIVAEGVENENQFELLKRMGCDSIQGYYFSRPLRSNDFRDEILRNIRVEEKEAKQKANLTILVVDDLEMNRVAVAENLNDVYRVVQAEDGMEAWEILQKDLTGVDLVITDIMMPNLNGFELIKKIKSNEYLKSIPVIILSAMEETESELRALRLGALDIIAKPFEPEVLKRRVENILRVSINESAQAELHALRKSTVLREKNERFLQRPVVGICQIVVSRNIQQERIRIIFANQEYCRIHHLEPDRIATVNKVERILNGMPVSERTGIIKLLQKIIKSGESQVQYSYCLNEHIEGEKHILCNMYIEYRQDEIHFDIAEMLLQDQTMFHKAEIVEEFLFEFLKNTHLNFWEYHIESGQFEMYQTDKEEVERLVIENGPEAMEHDRIFYPRDRERIRKLHQRVRRGEENVQEIFLCRKETDQIDEKWWNKITYQTIFDESGNPKVAFALSEDISEYKDMDQNARGMLELYEQQKRQEGRYLQDLASRDALTGLYHKAEFKKCVQQEMGRQRQSIREAVLLMIDVDNLEVVNNRFGQDFGDALLRMVAEQIRKVFTDAECIGRIGDDVFGVFQSKVAVRSVVEKKIQQLQQNMHMDLGTEKGQVRVSCSIGVAFALDCGQEYYKMHEKASEALYYAKKMGKDRYHIAGE